MSLGVTDEQNYTDIANAIRTMASGSGAPSLTLTPAEIATAIQGLKAYDVIPTMLSATETNPIDLNDLKPANTTWYYTSAADYVLNKPYTGGGGFNLVVFRTSSSPRVQIMFYLGGQIWSRYFRSNVWSTWIQWPVNFTTPAYHNSIYRGNAIGTEVTTEQYASISAGTFENLYVGDYWKINNINWRIAGFNYWYMSGDAGNTRCTTNHVVIVPDSSLVSGTSLNNTNTTEGGYAGSDFFTGNNGNTLKAQAIAVAESAFGANHILERRDFLSTVVTDGCETARAWFDTKLDLMTEYMVYGCSFFHNILHGDTLPRSSEQNSSQLPLFALDHSAIYSSPAYWLRDVVSSTQFALVSNMIYSAYTNATGSVTRGVRPAFAICA